MQPPAHSGFLIGALVFGGLVLVAGMPLLQTWTRRLNLEPLVGSRIQFLVLGLVLSEWATGAWNQTLVRQVDALVTLGLGILGLLLGLDFAGAPPERRLVRAATVETAATLVLVAVPFFFLLDAVRSIGPRDRAVAAALVGCAAAISGRRRFSPGEGRESPAFGTLSRVADLSNVISVLAAGTLLAVLSARGGLSSYESLLALAAIGTVGGLGAWLLATETKAGPLRTALLLGVLLVTAGTATHLALPPVAATLVMGLTIARLPGSLASELRESLDFLQAPFRALLLVMAGAAMVLPTATEVLAVFVFLSLRTAGKILGGRAASALASDVLPANMGLGLLPSSAVAVGLALDFHATAPPGVARVVVTTAVLGSLLSETAGLWTTRALVRAHALSGAAFGAVTAVAVAEPVVETREELP